MTARVWIEEDEDDEYFVIELFLEEWKRQPDATGIMTIIDGG